MAEGGGAMVPWRGKGEGGGKCVGERWGGIWRERERGERGRVNERQTQTAREREIDWSCDSRGGKGWREKRRSGIGGAREGGMTAKGDGEGGWNHHLAQDERERKRNIKWGRIRTGQGKTGQDDGNRTRWTRGKRTGWEGRDGAGGRWKRTG